MTRSILLISLLYLAACKCPATTESGSIQSLTYEEKSEDYKECLGDACAKVNLTYPVFEGDTNLANIINRQITEQNVQMWVTGDQQYEGMDDAVSSFFDTYKDFRHNFPDATQEWTFETVAKVTHQSDSLISIRFDNFSYLGGAHPNTMVTYINLDLSQNADILVREKMLINRERLLELTEEKFREHHEVDPAVSLEKDGRFFLNEAKFFLPVAMGYEGDEFVLVYNSYEIGPYAMGRTELRFSLAELDGVIYGGTEN